MNYSVELWDSYNKVENNLLFHLRGLKDFIYMLKEINRSYKIFSENIKKIFDMNLSITTNESLSVGIENFRNFLLFNHNFLEKYISSIISEAINPLNTLQETLLKKLNNNYKETINAEKNYESYINQIDFTRNKFHSRAKQVENKLLALEMIKNNIDNNKEEKLDQNDIDKLDEELNNYIGFA
jgi:tRNA nucleotidyltransferase/poly(A) polymerase